MRYAVTEARSNGWRDAWDFNDLDLSEQRFRASLEEQETAAGRAALFTQLARIEGLRGDFAAGERGIARDAVGKALRALGRIDEATGQLERAVAWATETGIETPYFHEELAECYAAAGRTEEARVQAERARELFREHEAAGARLGRLLEPEA